MLYLFVRGIVLSIEKLCVNKNNFRKKKRKERKKERMIAKKKRLCHQKPRQVAAEESGSAPPPTKERGGCALTACRGRDDGEAPKLRDDNDGLGMRAALQREGGAA